MCMCVCVASAHIVWNDISDSYECTLEHRLWAARAKKMPNLWPISGKCERERESENPKIQKESSEFVIAYRHDIATAAATAATDFIAIVDTVVVVGRSICIWEHSRLTCPHISKWSTARQHSQQQPNIVRERIKKRTYELEQMEKTHTSTHSQASTHTRAHKFCFFWMPLRWLTGEEVAEKRERKKTDEKKSVYTQSRSSKYATKMEQMKGREYGIRRKMSEMRGYNDALFVSYAFIFLRIKVSCAFFVCCCCCCCRCWLFVCFVLSEVAFVRASRDDLFYLLCRYCCQYISEIRLCASIQFHCWCTRLGVCVCPRIEFIFLRFLRVYARVAKRHMRRKKNDSSHDDANFWRKSKINHCARRKRRTPH